LQGGTRVLLNPAEEVSPETLDLMVESLKERLNVYGLGDVVVTIVSDRPDFLGGGNRFILVEIAGVSEEEVRELLGKQGKFEAKIGQQTVFKGGQDITYVCRTAQCSGIDPNRGCSRAPEGWGCSFAFSITLSPDAAARQAELTKDLGIIEGSLSEQLVLYLDDQEVDRLNIAADLRGRAVTDIQITGGGQGPTEQGAIENALKNMKRLQTILITGSLPVKIEIERIDNISPTLGKEFLKNALYVGLFALLGVAIVLIIIYRKTIIAFPILFTAISEIFLTLSVAALIGWNIDLAAIAGIILAVGTGVNDQIVITDESIRRQTDVVYNWKDRIKRAFFIIFSAYLTMVFAMVPLLFAGAGLLKGFAITTILAVTVGVLITRPAYAAIVQMLLE
jgi:preprotein translocase subunit SecD